MFVLSSQLCVCVCVRSVCFMDYYQREDFMLQHIVLADQFVRIQEKERVTFY